METPSTSVVSNDDQLSNLGKRPNTTTNKSTNKRKPGKAALDRKQEKLRVRKNEEYDKTVIKNMIDDFHSSLTISASDFAPNYIVLSESTPPKVTKISTTHVEHVLNETFNIIKPFTKMTEAEFQEFVTITSAATKWQLKAKEYYARLGSSKTMIDMNGHFNSVALHLDCALNPVAAMIDHVGKFEHDRQHWIPEVYSPYTPGFNEQDPIPGTFDAERMYQFWKRNRAGSAVYVRPVQDIGLLEHWIAAGYIVVDAAGTAAFSPGIFQHPNEFAVHDNWYTSEVLDLPPTEPPILRIIQRFAYFKALIEKRLPWAFSALHLVAGSGTPAQLARSVIPTLNGQVDVWCGRRIHQDLMFFSALFRLKPSLCPDGVSHPDDELIHIVVETEGFLTSLAQTVLIKRG